jgi:UDPglucose 6-dehydrogenase
VAVNDQRKRAMGRKVIAALHGDVRGKTVAILGLTFKPNTDDMRDAPSIAIIQTLKDAGASIRAFDPEGMEMARSVIDGVEYCSDAYDAVAGAHCVALVTEWNAFRSLDLARVKAAMVSPVLVDLRNVYRRHEVEAAGFAYSSIGRPEDSGAHVGLTTAAE